MAVSVMFGSSLWGLIEPNEAKVGRSRDVAASTTILVRPASMAAMVSGIGWMAGSLVAMTGELRSVFDPDTIWLLFFATPFGPVLVLRIVLLAILLVLAFASISNHARLVSILMLAGLLLVSQAWLGHAAQGGAGIVGSIMIVVYAIHVLAAGAWAGALPALLLSVVARSERNEIFDLLRRYSAMATVAVVAILGSGLANTLFRTDGAVTTLVSSAYGMVLFVKVGLVVAMLVCAAWIRFIAMPGLCDRVARSRLLSALRIGLSLELVLGLLVLGVAALLGLTPPPA